MKKLLISAASALVLGAGSALASGGAAHIPDYAFSFEGPFGKFDQQQLRRGFQVYREVCSACHGMKFVPLRTLSDEGGPQMDPAWVRAFAAEQDEITDKETGEPRARKETDMFPTRTGDGMGPDLSLIAKNRAAFHGPYGTGIAQLVQGIGGPEYIHAIRTHFEENPECAPDGIDGYYYNTAFPNGGIPDSCKDEHGASTVPGSWIAMPPPLADDLIEYEDGTPATVEQMAEDASAFLMWAAEPKMMARKNMGFTAVLLLGLLTVLLYLTNKRIWAPHKGKHV